MDRSGSRRFLLMNTNESNSLKKTKVLVGMAIFTALVVVLQLMAGTIKIGPFAPSLVLIPIVIGAAVYGCNMVFEKVTTLPAVQAPAT